MGRQRGRTSFERPRRASRRRRDVWVYTEGELTEPQYIDLVKELQPERRNQVHIADDSRRAGGGRGSGGRGADRKPADLVDRAVEKLQELRSQVDDRLPEALAPTVWCIFDRDDHQGVDEAIARAQRAGVRVAFSNPCFELWRLLHRQVFTNRCSGRCEEVGRLVPTVIGVPSRDRKSVTMPQIEGGFAQAKKRAVKLANEYASHVPPTRRDPYTDVWRFVEDLGVTDY